LKVSKNKLKNFASLIYRLSEPLFNPKKTIKGVPLYINYIKDWIRYSQLENNEKLRIKNAFPCIYDKTKTTSIDTHYFYQDIWAFKKILKSKAKKHIDVGSRIYFVGVLTAITKVIFIDIRPLVTNLNNFESRKGNILTLPFEDNSIKSLSCLHVAEHIGLGRYGDTLDPRGSIKACEELQRVLAKKGNLYFSLPVGKPRTCFNAHRVHSPRQILRYFDELKLIEFSGIDDNGRYIENIDTDVLEKSNYACGLFHFRKE